MAGSGSSCPIATIPKRLHRRNRAAVAKVDGDNWLYIRHPPLKAGEPYGSKGIPGHDHMHNQSANSHNINRPRGRPTDVLYDSADGDHFFGWRIAGLRVREVEGLNLPNENTTYKRVKGVHIQVDPDLYSFRVAHDPKPCMYPHCEIRAFKNRQLLTRDIKNSMRTVIRREFGKLADKNREEMKLRLCLNFSWSCSNRMTKYLIMLIVLAKATFEGINKGLRPGLRKELAERS